MPARYTADGEGLSPPLEWSGIPNDAAATAILIEDPDAPSPRPLVHGIVAGLSAAHQGGVGEGGLNYPAGAAEGAISEGGMPPARSTSGTWDTFKAVLRGF